jgi:small subunit ribosomal protein S4e
MLQVRTDATYPAGFMDVIEIEKTGEQFRLVYDVKGRFVVHRISPEEASYKLAKVGQPPDLPPTACSRWL